MAKASELINRSNTICHYKRFSGFSEPNCNGCNAGDSKMVELLHLFAESGLDDDSGALSIQVLQEFYVQAPRASRADAVPHELARGLIEAWSRFRIQAMTLPILNAALRIRKTRGVFIFGQRHRRRRSGPRLRPDLHRRPGPWASGRWPRHYRPIPLTVAPLLRQRLADPRRSIQLLPLRRKITPTPAPDSNSQWPRRPPPYSCNPALRNRHPH